MIALYIDEPNPQMNSERIETPERTSRGMIGELQCCRAVKRLVAVVYITMLQVRPQLFLYA